MDNLKVLIKIISNRATAKDIKYLENCILTKKERELYFIIKSQHDLPETTICKKMYGEKTSKAFIILKKKLLQKLLNLVYKLDYSSKNIKTALKAEYEALKLITSGNLLALEGALKIGNYLLLKGLKLAIKAELTPLILLALDNLKYLYVTLGKANNFKLANREYEKYLAIHIAEKEVHTNYFLLLLNLRKSTINKWKHLPEINKQIEDVENKYNDFKTINLFEILFKLRVFQMEIKGDYSKCLIFFEEINKDYESEKINYLRFDHRFNLYIILNIYLRTRNYREGLQFAFKYLPEFNQHSKNRFLFIELVILIYLHQNQFSLAKDLLSQTIINQKFDLLNPKVKDKWKLYNQYIQLFSEEYSWKDAYNSFENFKTRTLNKSDYFLAMLMLEILLQLKSGLMENLNLKIESANSYIHKKLTKNSKQRPKIFFQMISLLLYHDKKTKIIKLAEPLYCRLKEIPFPPEGEGPIEIVPYENIWEKVIGYLK
jgi:hypothetical protein